MASELEIMPPQRSVALEASPELSVDQVLTQVTKIQMLMERVMKEDTHYGKVPGTDKPTLLKAGAEKLCLTFRLGPEYDSVKTWDGAHLTVESRCMLRHTPSGVLLGVGEGMCSTKESKYAWRKSDRKCPKCGKEAIIKGKEEYGGGWLCFKKKDGCGAKFKDGDTSIESQAAGRVLNPDLPDVYNTVLKMANKRSLVAAVLNVTAASDIFTQDVEDLQAAEEKPAARKGAEIELEKIQGLLIENGMSGKTDEGKKALGQILWQHFGSTSWKEVQGMTIEVLRTGRRDMEQWFSRQRGEGDESIPFGDEEPPTQESER